MSLQLPLAQGRPRACWPEQERLTDPTLYRFMVIRPSTTHTNFNPKCTEPISIDFRETAPSGSYPHMFSPRPDDPSFDAARASKIGGLAIGVPGELRGLEAAYKACGGGVSWDRLFQPSADLARESKVGKELHRRLNASPFGVPMSQWMLEEKDWKAMFAPEGRLLVEGETLRREAYAQTLERVGREGVDIFYTGDIANSLLKTIKKEGGLLTAQDFAEYKAIVKPAFRSTYLNRTYYTTHYPSGGPIITNLLNTLEGYDDFVDQGKTGLSIHRFIEALKCEFAVSPSAGRPTDAALFQSPSLRVPRSETLLSSTTLPSSPRFLQRPTRPRSEPTSPT